MQIKLEFDKLLTIWEILFKIKISEVYTVRLGNRMDRPPIMIGYFN